MLYDLIVHSQTTTVELVDALITTKCTISNMGGPLVLKSLNVTPLMPHT